MTVNTSNLADRIGVSNNLFLNHKNQTNLLKNLAKDFHYLEVELEGHARYITDEVKNFRFAEEIRQISESFNTVINLHAPYKNVDILLNDKNLYEEGRRILLESAKFAIIMGAKTMTFHPGFRFPDRDDKVARKKALSIIEDIGYELFNTAKEHSSAIEFCIENTGSHRPYMVLTDEETEQIINNSPLKITLDVVHAFSFASTQEEGFDIIKKMAKFAGNIHIADMKFPKHIHVPIGEGDLLLESALSIIESTGYQGPYIVEETGNGYYGEQYVAGALKLKDRINNKISV